MKKMKKEPPERKYDVFLFFVFAALVMVFGLVLLEQMRDARFDARLSSIEDSVTKVEEGMDELVGVVRAYKRALNLPEVDDRGIEVGDRRRAK